MQFKPKEKQEKINKKILINSDEKREADEKHAKCFIRVKNSCIFLFELDWEEFREAQ